MRESRGYIVKNLKWAREIERFVGVKPQFVLWGNIYDIYPKEIDTMVHPLSLNNYLKHLLRYDCGYDVVISYEPLIGFRLIEGEEEDCKLATNKRITADKPLRASLVQCGEILESVVESSEVSVAVIFHFSSRLRDIEQELRINEFFYQAFRVMQNASPKLGKSQDIKEMKFNSIFWLMDRESDFPDWYSIDNPNIKTLSLAKPDSLIRELIINSLSDDIKGFEKMEESKQKESVNHFIDQTNGLYANEIISIVSMAEREGIELGKINEAIKRYKLGIIENEWAKIPKSKLLNAQKLLNKRVKGQKKAIIKASEVIKRAFFNLSGTQYSKYSNRPKGALFFAGPTGVGKTELAKAITNLLFGSETNYIRFDMSEFSKDHSDQRLIGAPPGYVGYDMGGELTNAIKQNPFSVVLFDEIEKAHPKIMDIFLQILDDGRITSGRGETVYFSEALIIFTSNLGIYDIDEEGRRIQTVDNDMPYSEVSETILNSINNYFKFNLQRPEILNRIGENIVVFDFIREDVAIEIFEKMLDSIIENLQESHKIEMDIESIRPILQIESTKNLSMGGRGIGNQLEKIFINPLSTALVEHDIQNNTKVELTNLIEEDGVWILELT
jgi:ATP-dependent Clp protease ATP-binding subunit ClpA